MADLLFCIVFLNYSKNLNLNYLHKKREIMIALYVKNLNSMMAVLFAEFNMID